MRIHPDLDANNIPCPRRSIFQPPPSMRPSGVPCYSPQHSSLSFIYTFQPSHLPVSFASPFLPLPALSAFLSFLSFLPLAGILIINPRRKGPVRSECGYRLSFSDWKCMRIVCSRHDQLPPSPLPTPPPDPFP